MGRRVRFERPSSNRSIGQWWTKEAEPNLTRVYVKFKSLVSKANTVGNVLGKTVQPADEELSGKPFAVLVCQGEWNEKWLN
jgi:hypothetical protein